jgi:hypothetical protein
MPPLRRVPQPVSALRLAQRGDKLEIAYTAPRNTTDGARLPIIEVEVMRMDGEGDFAKNAKHRRRKAAPGETLIERYDVPSPGTPVRVAIRALANGKQSVITPPASLTVKAPPVAPTKLDARLTPEGVALAWEGELPPPPPLPVPTPMPTAVEPTSPGASARTPSAAAPAPDTIAPAPAGPEPAPPAGTPPAAATAPPPGETPPSAPAPAATAAPSPPPPAVPSPGQVPQAQPPSAIPTPTPTPSAPPFPGGFWVYRRSAIGDYSRPLFATPTDAKSYVDASPVAGERSCYVVRMVVSVDPVIESAGSEEACVDVKDITPPAAPAGLTAVVHDGSVELNWSPSSETDLKLYRVYRAAGRGAPAPLADVPAGQTTFVDASPGEGAHRYTVTAVDRAGNESPASNAADARTP